jgi:hypothetical protein
MVPALGSDYNPKFTVSGGTVVSSNSSGQIVIIPNRPNVSVKISNNGTFIGKSDFKVKLIPPPEVDIKCNGKKINPISGNSLNDVARLELKLISEKSFKEQNPRDAQFSPKQWQIRLVRNKRVIGTKRLTQSKENIREFLAQKGVKSGDMLVIDEIKIKRRNYQNRSEHFNIGDKTFIILIK